MFKSFEMPEIKISRFESGISCDEGLKLSDTGVGDQIVAPVPGGGNRPRTTVSGTPSTGGVSAFE